MTLPSLALTVQGYSTKLPAAQDLPAADRHKPLSLSTGTSPCWDAASRRARARCARACCNCALAWQVWINERFVSRGGETQTSRSEEGYDGGLALTTAARACARRAHTHTITTLSCDDDLIKAGHGEKIHQSSGRGEVSPALADDLGCRDYFGFALFRGFFSSRRKRPCKRLSDGVFHVKCEDSWPHCPIRSATLVGFTQDCSFPSSLTKIRQRALSGHFISVHHASAKYLIKWPLSVNMY